MQPSQDDTTHAHTQEEKRRTSKILGSETRDYRCQLRGMYNSIFFLLLMISLYDSVVLFQDKMSDIDNAGSKDSLTDQ